MQIMNQHKGKRRTVLTNGPRMTEAPEEFPFLRTRNRAFSIRLNCLVTPTAQLVRNRAPPVTTERLAFEYGSRFDSPVWLPPGLDGVREICTGGVAGRSPFLVWKMT